MGIIVRTLECSVNSSCYDEYIRHLPTAPLVPTGATDGLELGVYEQPVPTIQRYRRWKRDMSSDTYLELSLPGSWVSSPFLLGSVLLSSILLNYSKHTNR